MTDAMQVADAVETYNRVVASAAALLPWAADHPVSRVQWVHSDRVRANDYNPNAVARNEMRLLHASIKADGFTQPIVAVRDQELFVIVDGFHRYTVARTQRDIYDSTGGYVPVVVLDKPLSERMASTIRHNRARGKHSVAGMSNLVFQLLQEGLPDEEICNELGLEGEELLRLKHITGFSKLLENHTYSRSWEMDKQLRIKAAWLAAHPEEPPSI